ncbi:MAG: ThuA domain-containing protein [Fimbriimonadaceae bacterium]|nr:ThuA domain-containing protein [Fimbriimonadaceae bacterium]
MLLAAGIALGMLSAPAAPLRVLVFSKTAGFRHDSIPVAVEAMKALATARRFEVECTEDAASFNAPNLAKFKVVMFLLTTGDALNDEQQTAFENWYRKGGGWVGVHSASDTEYGWEWFGRLVGAYFMSHPAVQNADVHIEDPKHPTMKGLPKLWQRRDEWYDFKSNPRSQVHVLATLDEKTYQGGKMGDDHPTVWCHEFDGGRAWYTAGGHTNESYAEPLFIGHVYEAIRWVSRTR